MLYLNICMPLVGHRLYMPCLSSILCLSFFDFPLLADLTKNIRNWKFCLKRYRESRGNWRFFGVLIREISALFCYFQDMYDSTILEVLVCVSVQGFLADWDETRRRFLNCITPIIRLQLRLYFIKWIHSVVAWIALHFEHGMVL